MAARSVILGLGSRLYPGNMQHILNIDLTRFMQSLSGERQNRARKRKGSARRVTLSLFGQIDEHIKESCDIFGSPLRNLRGLCHCSAVRFESFYHLLTSFHTT